MLAVSDELDVIELLPELVALDCADCVILTDEVPLPLSLGLWEALELDELDTLGLSLGLCDAVACPDVEGLSEVDAVSDGDGDGLLVPSAVLVPLMLDVPVRLPVPLWLVLALWLGELLPDAAAELVMLPETELEREGELVVVRDGEIERVGVGSAVSVPLPVLDLELVEEAV